MAEIAAVLKHWFIFGLILLAFGLITPRERPRMILPFLTWASATVLAQVIFGVYWLFLILAGAYIAP